MPLPQAIQAQLDEADAFYQKEPSTVEASQEDVNPSVPGEQSTPELVSDVSHESPTTVEPQPEQQEGLWEQRYKSFKGHADAELGRMGEQLKKSNQVIEELKQKLEALEEHKTQEVEKAREKENEITSDERETYGDDLIAVVHKIARQESANMLKLAELKFQALQKRNEDLEQQVGSVSQTVGDTVKQQFYTQLEQRVPDWQTINQDTQFLTWLGQVDPFTGVQRQALLDDAANANSVDRVVRIFSAYKDSRESSPETTSRNQELERQVSPSRSRGAGAKPSTDPRGGKKIWSQQELSAFYDDYARGRITPDEATKTEHEIYQAAAEGRITL